MKTIAKEYKELLTHLTDEQKKDTESIFYCGVLLAMGWLGDDLFQMKAIDSIIECLRQGKTISHTDGALLAIKLQDTLTELNSARERLKNQEHTIEIQYKEIDEAQAEIEGWKKIGETYSNEMIGIKNALSKAETELREQDKLIAELKGALENEQEYLRVLNEGCLKALKNDLWTLMADERINSIENTLKKLTPPDQKECE